MPDTRTPGPGSLGLDIGGTTTKLVLLDAQGNALYKATSPAYTRPTLETLSEALRSLLAEVELENAARSVGVCLPGQFEPDGLTVRYSANLPCLNGLRMPDLVRAVLDRTTAEPGLLIVPDARAAALGSWNNTPCAGRMLAVSLGTGVGVALLVAGRPVSLAPGTSGHLGQIDVSLSPDAPIGPDGGRGSLEAYVGLPALRARFGDSVSDGLAAVADDDPVLRSLARAIRIAHAIYTPDEIRLLGGVGIALTPRLHTLKSLVDRDLTAVAHAGWTLTAENDPYLAASGAAIGAASLDPG